MTATHTQMGPLKIGKARYCAQRDWNAETLVSSSDGAPFALAIGFTFAESEARAAELAELTAMRLALDMICAGVARIERLSHEVSEFCFQGLRYCRRDDSAWTATINAIGWNRCLEALAAARGGV